MSNDAAFLDVLAGCTELCDGMDLTDSGWKPVEGQYTVQLTKVETGTKQKNGVNNAWIRPVFTIVDGEFEGKVFNDYFWITPGKAEPTISMRNLCRFATCLSGHEVTDLTEAITIATEAVGEFINLEVYTNKGYKNIRFLSRIESTEAVTTGG